MAHSKKMSRKLSGQIRVLIVDDDPMAREAWRKVLSNSRQIQVVGEVSLVELRKFITTYEFPEVVVAGFAFIEAGYLQKGVLNWIVRPKFILIVENKEHVKVAFRNGADFSIAKPFDPEDLIMWVRTLGEDAKRLCSEYLEQFSQITATRADNERYYDLVNNTLQLLFHPDLVNPEFAPITGNTYLGNRLVFRNQARDHKFWVEAKEVHKSKYVTFDIYNGAITADDVKRLSKYLSDTHGQMGVVLGRKSESASLHTILVSIFENEKKIIFALDDTHLKAMLVDKAGGINPVYELEKLYQKLITEAIN